MIYRNSSVDPGLMDVGFSEISEIRQSYVKIAPLHSSACAVNPNDLVTGQVFGRWNSLARCAGCRL